MIRGVAKGAGLAAIGRIPGGVAAYRAFTRGALGTGAGHVAKQGRVWPGYARVWRDAGLVLDGARAWLHEPGPAPLPALAAYALTGHAAVVTTSDRLRTRYLAPSIDGVLAADLPGVPAARRAALDGLRWATDATEAVARLGGAVHVGAPVDALPLPDAAIELAHSGGALEHLAPAALRAFLAELRRVLAPGGLASHVIDHRDHLWHADKGLPFLGHLAVPDAAYRLVLGGPLTYHNRMSSTAIVAAFVAAGLTPVRVRRLILPAHAWVDDDAAALAGAPGLARRHLARAHRGWSDVDLRTAATHVIARVTRPRAR